MLDIVGVLQSEKNAFTRSERVLADLILHDVEAALKLPIVDLAARADVSPPTVTRFCRRLGCDNYADFKVRLAKSRFVGQRYVVPESGPQTVREIAHGVITGIQSTIFDTFDRLAIDALERAAETIINSSYVLSYGSGGSSSMAATEMETRLYRLGLKASSSIDHQAQIMRAAGAPADTVLIAFSLSGNNVPLVEALKVAGEYGISRIVITRSGSSVSSEADILIPIDREENVDIFRPTPGRYALLAVTDILAQTVATRLGPSAVASMRRIKHQLVVTRDGDDSQPLGD
ncbi:MurR/RpiR family transcriptional regulator [Devosia rhodophyticola]|uniref:MurR/RpiR family transcriptional regulator n=1 Tax=Devosia rhodophyticola TaxID=3026423 RepID=A0ABY7Z2A6_9HYPH|nr:MurR/RpiR family transcriptional regulator [Devosia rhodophyticola]WDR07594.1 MurR/RpiR family transcriptional regulator [Devosia rhodophyticola]